MTQGFSTLLFAGILALSMPGPLVLAEDSATDHQADLQRVQTRLKSLRQQIRKDQAEESRTTRRLRETEQAISTTKKELSKLDHQLQIQDKELQGLVTLQRQESALLTELQSDLAAHMRSAYLLGRQGKLRVLFTHENPAAIGRLFAYHHYLYTAHTEGMVAVSAQLEKLDSLEDAASRKQLVLLDLRKSRLKKQSGLEAQRSSRRVAIRDLKVEISRQGHEVTRLEKDQGRLQSLLNSLQQSLSDITGDTTGAPFSGMKGRLSWPAAGRVKAGFGQRRGLGNLKWRGVLIEAPAGTEVRAVTGGRVAFVDWLRGFGLMVILDHGDGYMSLYGFNQDARVEEGAWVEKGEVIARVGDTGGQERPGLYFELRKGAKPLNPSRWCKGRPRPASIAVKP